MNKIQARAKRSKKAKFTQKRIGLPRLVVHRSNKLIYAQVVSASDKGDVVIAAASTKDKEFKSKLEGNKTAQAKEVGKLVAKRAIDKGCKVIAFDRAGYKYHGRVKAVAEGAREEGLDF